MVGQLDMKVKQVSLIVNRAPGGKLEPGIEEEIKLQNLTLAGVIPQDDLVYQYDAAGKPLVSLPEDSAVKTAVAGIAVKLGL
jgi:CO dehydrogenase maturation factor